MSAINMQRKPTFTVSTKHCQKPHRNSPQSYNFHEVLLHNLFIKHSNIIKYQSSTMTLIVQHPSKPFMQECGLNRKLCRQKITTQSVFTKQPNTTEYSVIIRKIDKNTDDAEGPTWPMLKSTIYRMLTCLKSDKQLERKNQTVYSAQLQHFYCHEIQLKPTNK